MGLNTVKLSETASIAARFEDSAPKLHEKSLFIRPKWLNAPHHSDEMTRGTVRYFVFVLYMWCKDYIVHL